MSLPDQTFWQRVSGYFSPAEQIKLPLPTEKLIAASQKTLKEKKVVLVACGSFNPPTIMHLRMFELAKDHFAQEGCEVIAGYISPVNDAYQKEGLLPASKRIHMAKACTEDHELLEVDEWESLQPAAQRSLTVLKRISDCTKAALLEAGQKSEPEIRLICGSDLVESMLKPGVWIPEQIVAILSDFGIICISRDAGDLMQRVAADKVMGSYVQKISVIEDAFQNNLSSSLIRSLVSQGKSIKYLVPEGVRIFIEANKMYQ